MIRVGMVGMFPLVAKAERRRRLGDVEIHPYSYHARSAPSWPSHVTPLERRHHPTGFWLAPILVAHVAVVPDSCFNVVVVIIDVES